MAKKKNNSLEKSPPPPFVQPIDSSMIDLKIEAGEHLASAGYLELDEEFSLLDVFQEFSDSKKENRPPSLLSIAQM